MFTAGYALSVGPANAQAITTGSEGLSIMEGAFKGHGDYAMPFYLARPAARGRYPAVIVVNEIFGIHAYIKDVCRRLAKLGYVAIAPDYFDRAGDPAILTDMAQVRPIVSATTQPQVLGDTAGALAFLKRQRFVAAQKIAITGYCWGGAIVWLAAARFPEIKAGAAWYGRLTPRRPQDFGYSENQLSPIGEAANLKAPVLGLYAEKDGGIPLDSVEAMRAALAANGNPTKSEIVVYPGAEHGFHADYRPSFNPAAAADGWARMLAWFQANGVR
jgi:carboxymethylenebutenolidase